ncbi:hypothetical protein LJC26_02430 [Desulfovibrio sp. OttesenSCG-928-O18]|nr:hypothetical protein [Desulfovibrio sp. OttesenSCG-928-O18]
MTDRPNAPAEPDAPDGLLSPAETNGSGGENFAVSPSTEPANTSEPAREADLLHDIPEAPHDAELVRLRKLLFTREIALLEKLATLQSQKQYGTEKVSEVIAEAILLRSGKDSQLNLALEPLVDEILKVSLRKRQADFVNVLFPLMGPSLRKSIAETFRSMLESFSQSVEMAFSWKGLRWRFEAWRAGKPFSEIVLLHTLVYRVEQVFFIHSDTGLVLAHMDNEGAGSQDADMVSAMLTAIQDFVRDSFSSGADGELSSLQTGEFTIFIEKSPKAYLACVVRGTPPATFRTLLRETLELMLVEFSEALANFSGDTSSFMPAARYLDALLVARYVDDKDKKLPLWARVLPIVLVLAIAGGAGFYYYRERQIQIAEQAFTQTMEGAVSLLRAEPGLLVMNVAKNKTGPWEVLTLKDGFTREPATILRENGFDETLFSFKNVPFISYDAPIVSRRAQTGIELPETVRMSFDGKGTLTFSGTAPMSWILKAREEARNIPGVEQVDMKDLHDPNMEKIKSMIKAVETVSIEFPTAKDVPVPEDLPTLQKAVETLVELEKLAGEMGFVISLTIYGHADTTGLEKRNYEISQARTRTVAAMLYAKGSSLPIAMYGMGAEYPKGGSKLDTPELKARRADQASRRIELRVHLARSASADTESLLQ